MAQRRTFLVAMRRIPLRFWVTIGLAVAVVAVLGGVAISGSSSRGDAQAQGGPATPRSTLTTSGPAGTRAPSATDGASSSAPSSEAASSGGGGLLSQVARREPHDPEALGRLDAPVVMVEFADFQCPFCGKFARDTEPALVKKYVDTGKLRIEWHDFPYFGPQSKSAAVAARAAGEQGKFWQYWAYLYHHQQAPNSGYLTTSFLTHIARVLHLNMAQWQAAFHRSSLAAVVTAEFQVGQALGVQGTPSFIIGNEPVGGAQPLSVFDKIIDQQLTSS